MFTAIWHISEEVTRLEQISIGNVYRSDPLLDTALYIYE